MEFDDDIVEEQLPPVVDEQSSDRASLTDLCLDDVVPLTVNQLTALIGLHTTPVDDFGRANTTMTAGQRYEYVKSMRPSAAMNVAGNHNASQTQWTGVDGDSVPIETIELCNTLTADMPLSAQVWIYLNSDLIIQTYIL